MLQPKVSLMICSYNRERDLVESVGCALQQDYPNYEVVVIDQTPTHQANTTAYLDSVKSQIRYFFQTTPSITKARNRAVEEATGEILIFVDDDTLFDPDFIWQHVKAHQTADLVQGRIYEPGRNPKANKPQWLRRDLKITGSNDCTKSGFTNTITGANFSFKQSVINKIGGFDESYTRFAVREEADFAIRAVRHGFKIAFAPEAKVLHKRQPGGVDSGIGQHFFNESYYYNELRFCFKYFGPLVRCYYRWRLYRRGKRALLKLIKLARQNALASLEL